jgi:hypothetical protein
MTYSVDDALNTFSKLIADEVVTVSYEKNCWAIKWDNSNFRIYLATSFLDSSDYPTKEEAFSVWWNARRMNLIKCFTHLPSPLVDAIIEWQKGWKEKKDEENLEYLERFT